MTIILALMPLTEAFAVKKIKVIEDESSKVVLPYSQDVEKKKACHSMQNASKEIGSHQTDSAEHCACDNGYGNASLCVQI